MSDNRSRYSSAPMQNLKRMPRPVRSRVPQPPRTVGDYQDASMPSRNFAVLQVLLTILLPLFFLVALIMRSTTVYWAFAAASAGSLLVMWLLSAFVPNARLTLSFIHIAMILVALTAIFMSPSRAPAQQQGKQAAAGTQQGDIQGIFSRESSASIRDMTVTEGAAQGQGGPQQSNVPNASSAAQQKLEQFMAAWVVVDYKGMVSLAVPAWVNQQKDPVQSMFQVRQNRTPVDYQVQAITGSDADSTRTIDMLTTISKNNGEAPEKYMIQVLMIRVNDVWYVDPSSLGSSQRVQDSSNTAPPVVTVAPMVTSDPNMMIYYNPDGGSFYHVDANCKRIKADYLPLKGSFRFSQVNDSEFSKLQPCDTCHAPPRR